MKNNELNLSTLIGILKKNKILFLSIFMVLSILSIVYVFQIEKSYKSSLVMKMPLLKGIETEYTINNLAKIKAVQLNESLGLQNSGLQLKKLQLTQIKHQSDATFGVLHFITTKPDYEHKVKNSFISYINKMEFFEKLLKLEKEKNKDLILTAVEQYKSLKELQDNNENSTNLTLQINPMRLKEKKHETIIAKSFINSIVEISYNVSPNKFKPSYGILVVLSVFFAFFISFTVVIAKTFFIN